MACKVERFQSAGKGNGLRATVPCIPGEELYVAEPYAYTVSNTGFGHVCEACLCSTGHLLQCSRCKFAKYCSKQCQAQAWPDHKSECKCLKDPGFGTALFRLVFRILVKMLRKSPCPSEELYSMAELKGHFENLSGEDQMDYQLFGEMLKNYLRRENLDPLHLTDNLNIADFFAKEVCNGFIITNEMMLSAAVGLYPSMSLLNHSCQPNCTGIFMGRHFHLRAIRTIQTGEELTITYTECLMCTVERQKSLRRKYFFECDCHRCLTQDNDDTMLAGDQEASNETKALISKVRELQENEQWAASLSLCRAQIARNAGRVPDENVYQLEILECAMQACVTLNLQAEALHHGTRTLEPYRLYAPAMLTNYPLKLMEIGILLLEQGRIPKAMETLQEALKDMEIFLGRAHPKTQLLLKVLQVMPAIP
ncbi:histone-lysine N-methyltransferase SMYD3-like isoform X2 [Ambystoma mexicanum]|uniref:histone-lysine N-methyltransferase SMYD3-like isoform X2 n=1 Tax=Ambystoma mexicanum TaxID=8296 RepID=UPI0037E98973